MSAEKDGPFPNCYDLFVSWNFSFRRNTRLDVYSYGKLLCNVYAKDILSIFTTGLANFKP